MASLRKIYIPLDGAERSALTQLAIRERRDPRAQAALIIRRGLESAGLLPADIPGATDPPPPAAQSVEAAHAPAN